MTAQPETVPTITCKATLFTIGTWTILRLPEAASKQLPSRGQVMVEGTLNDVRVRTPLEPDGNFSHWFHVGAKLLAAAGVSAGDTVRLQIAVTKDWPEPPVPADLKRALAGSPKARALWRNTTPMARWEWVRWTRSTGSAETRQRRVAVAISKLEAGKRRPCCWNRNLCTEPEVCKSGVLLARPAG